MLFKSSDSTLYLVELISAHLTTRHNPIHKHNININHRTVVDPHRLVTTFNLIFTNSVLLNKDRKGTLLSKHYICDEN